jgi:hypothetical protein
MTVEVAKAGLTELQSGLAALGEQAPNLIMIEAYWSWVDAELSSAGFVGFTASGTRIYLEVNCHDDTEEREVQTEMRHARSGSALPAVQPSAPSAMVGRD